MLISTLNPGMHRYLAAIAIAVVWAKTTLHAQSGRPDVTVDSAARTEAITNLAQQTEATYVDSAVAKRTAAAIRTNLRSGRYQITSARTLAELLTRDLRSLTGDQHFLVDYFVVPRAFNVSEPAADPLSEAQHKRALELQNFGFTRIERLAGNIGYMRLDHFEEPSLIGNLLAATMQFLSGTDALILDLRNNGGGSPATVTLLESYFIGESTHIGDLIGRTAGDLKQRWTHASVQGPKYLNRPVYVLTGPRTFSAAEAVAYDLQSLKRAQIVGETTRGGANPSARQLLSARFGVIMPIARTVNPVTNSNWEGGVKPDIAVSSDLALESAHLAALRSAAPLHADDPLTQEIQRAISELTAPRRQ